MSNTQQKPSEQILASWKQINDLMDVRRKQFEEAYQEKWWENLIGDEHYMFLCRKLVEIKQLQTNPGMKIELTDDQLQMFASGLLTPEEFISQALLKEQKEEHE